MSTHAFQPDNQFLDEFLDDFFAECDEHLASVRRDLLALEAASGQPHAERSLISELLRSFHTLKGLSGMIGMPALEQLAHQIESYLRALSQRQVTLTAEALSALVGGTQMIDQVLAHFRAQQPSPDIAVPIARLAALVPPKLPEPAAQYQATSSEAQQGLSPEERAQIDVALRQGTPLWQIVFVPTPELTERNVNVNFTRARLIVLGEIIRAVPRVLEPGKLAFEFIVAAKIDPATLDAWREDGISYTRYVPPEEQAAEAPQIASTVMTPSNVVRVDLARIDTVISIVGDLVISRARLTKELEPLELSVPVPSWRALQETTTTLERQLRHLRQGVMQMRLVPIGEVFARMQFVIHDIARESHKQVALELQGQETEIDKFVVERMLQPLLHLVRNAVSHGLEPADVRAAHGKPPAGRIRLGAATAGDLVRIEIEDDGRGIDPERVADRARALGILGADEPCDPAMLLDIICAPGFSTREQADRVSGRGVGMDVVKRTVHELGGMLSLDTTVGQGTRFSIQLPLTLAIADALIVAAGNQTFAMPMPSLREVIEVVPAQLTALENNELLDYRGGALPLMRLAHRFRLGESARSAQYALVVGNGPSAIGIVVDRIVGKREIVVRPLADPLIQIEGLAGATEMGDGYPVLILDALALTRARRQPGRAPLTHVETITPLAPARSAPGAAKELANAGKDESQDHNGSERAMTGTQQIAETYVLCELASATYGIPSRVVRQIEMIDHITPVPNAPPFVAGIVFSRGQVIPALDLRLRFGYEKIPYTLRSRLVVITAGGRIVGVVVDTAREFVTIPTEAIQPPPEGIAELSGAYVYGIARVGERLVVLLDLNEVLYGAETIAPVQEER